MKVKNMPKKIHDLADELGIKVDTLRKQIYTGKYIGKHYFMDNNNEPFSFNITEKDIIEKIENGRKTKFLSDRLCELIRIIHDFEKEKKQSIIEDPLDDIATDPIREYSNYYIESIRQYLDLDQRLSQNKKTRIVEKMSKFTQIISNLETELELMVDLFIEIETAFDCKYGRIDDSNKLDTLMIDYSSRIEQFDNWKKGNYEDIDKIVSRYTRLREKYRQVAFENMKDEI